MVTGVRYLFDTNTLSALIEPRANATMIARINALWSICSTAAPVIHEIAYGAMRLPPSRRRRAIEDYLRDTVLPTLPILPYDVAAAEWHARERARLVAIGRTPPLVDGQIAAIAAVNNLIVVTSNVADFRAFDGLEVEDWRT